METAALSYTQPPDRIDLDGFDGDEEPLPFDSDAARIWYWVFVKRFIQHPGQHLCTIGRTGTGKTQGLYWMVDLFREHAPDEAILWFDLGKGSEILTLAEYFGPVTVWTLPGCNIEISAHKEYDIKFKEVASCRDIWRASLTADRLNIASFEPFILDPTTYTREISRMFIDLVYAAHRRQIYRPLCMIADEFHNVAPAWGYGYAGEQSEKQAQNRAINYIRRNIQKLRNEGIRIIASTHEWNQMFQGVRTSFEWMLLRRGAKFTSDEPKLRQYNPRWGGMETEEAYLVLPTRTYSRPLKMPHYVEGDRLGTVYYDGIYETEIEV